MISEVADFILPGYILATSETQYQRGIRVFKSFLKKVMP
jgi:hypothetical protein